jgi:hypothetical protein
VAVRRPEQRRRLSRGPAEENWVPRVLKAGFKHWAIVVPSTAVAEMQMKALQAKRRKQGIAVEMFEAVEEAMAWLRSR